MRRVRGWGGVHAGRTWRHDMMVAKSRRMKRPPSRVLGATPPFAAEYLNTLLEDGDQGSLFALTTATISRLCCA
jgi:hypothetical protein